MKVKIAACSVTLVVCLLVQSLLGQQFGFPGRGNRTPHGISGNRGVGGSHVGVFPITSRNRVDSWFFGGLHRRGGRAFGGRSSYFSPHFSVYGRAIPKNYSSAYFVQKWKDRNPTVRPGDQSMEGSVLLSKGMNKAAVMGALGSPIERIKLENRELWRYSSYSLLFESGVLVELR